MVEDQVGASTFDGGKRGAASLIVLVRSLCVRVLQGTPVQTG